MAAAISALSAAASSIRVSSLPTRASKCSLFNRSVIPRRPVATGTPSAISRTRRARCRVMTATVTGTIGLISDNAELLKPARTGHVRAPSSVVEHVTFNHGVLGSIPRGPILSSLITPKSQNPNPKSQRIANPESRDEPVRVRLFRVRYDRPASAFSKRPHGVAGPTRCPFKAETAGSNPAGDATHFTVPSARSSRRP
jgi:hypothetical protein